MIGWTDAELFSGEAGSIGRTCEREVLLRFGSTERICFQIPNGMSRNRTDAQLLRTFAPPSRAKSENSRANKVLPIPASPERRKMRPKPARDCCRAAASVESSRLLPTKSELGFSDQTRSSTLPTVIFLYREYYRLLTTIDGPRSRGCSIKPKMNH